MGHSLPAAGSRAAKGLDSRPQLRRCLIPDIRRVACLVQDGLQPVGQRLHQVHRIGGLPQNGCQLVDHPGEPGAQAVDRVDVSVSPRSGGIRQIADGLPGFLRPAGDGLHPLREFICGALEIIAGPVHQSPQAIQRVQQLPQPALIVEQAHLRFQLTGDAAHILPAQDRAAVDTAIQIAGLPPHDAANVVPHVGIAHMAGVDAALEDPRGESGDAADVGAHRCVLRRIQLLPVEIVQVQGGIHLCGVDIAAVLTPDDGAEVLPGNAAHGVLSGD